jgi:hypothetical protein
MSKFRFDQYLTTLSAQISPLTSQISPLLTAPSRRFPAVSYGWQSLSPAPLSVRNVVFNFYLE